MSRQLQQQTTVGAWLWVISLQYYIAQFVVAAAWSQANRYSWAQNTISDLANTHCGPYGTRLVCSPLHSIMNTSFLLLGMTIIAGAFMLRRTRAHSRIGSVGFIMMAWSGVGTLFVGLFPENTTASLHITGAALSFVLGNAAMILLGSSLRLPKLLWIYSIASGALGLVALVFFITKTYLGIGIGGMERVVAYPQSVWMIVFGGYLLLRTTPEK